MKRSIIITAGGIGTRMGETLPKQFLLLEQKPVLIHTLEAFHAFDPHAQLIITLPHEWQSYWHELLDKYNIEIAHQLVDGGKERFHSIHNALQVCDGKQIGIHDGVRPLVSQATIKRCFDGLDFAKAVVPVLKLKDSIRMGSESNSKSVDRGAYFLVHTPQCFDAQTLKAAYQHGFDPKFTDDASVVEALNIMPLLVESNEENIKITTPLDLKILHALFEK